MQLQMERLPALDEEEGEDLVRQPRGIFSCWGRLRLAAVWRRLKRFQSERRRRSRSNRLYVRRGSLNYDPLSYAQNFDDGYFEGDDEDGERIRRNFSSRFAPPHPPAGNQSQRTDHINLMD